MMKLLKRLFIDQMQGAQKAYDEIVERLKDKYISEGIDEKPAEKKAI